MHLNRCSYIFDAKDKMIHIYLFFSPFPFFLQTFHIKDTILAELYVPVNFLTS